MAYINFLACFLNTAWGIYTVAGSDYDYNAQPTYVLDVECDDGTTTVSADFTVNLQPNLPPVIQNLPGN